MVAGRITFSWFVGRHQKGAPEGGYSSIIKNYEHLREITWDCQPGKAVARSESEYVKMELTYFKPFHAERAGRGIMNNWSLYKPITQYVEKYPYDYETLNGFSTWQQITAVTLPVFGRKFMETSTSMTCTQRFCKTDHSQ